MKFRFLLLFFLITSPLIATEEVAILEELIEETKNKLEEEKKLLKIVHLFNEARKAFIAEPDSARLATKLVTISMLLQREMENNHLADIFPKEFLEEITFFSHIGSK